jgi:hypothetical protein
LAMRDEVDTWVSNVSRTALGDKMLMGDLPQFSSSYPYSG